MASTDARPVPYKNTAYRVTFPILDEDGDPVTGATALDSEVSIDGGTFADCTNEATEIATSSGVYFLDLTAGEMNGDTISVIVKTTTAGAKTTVIVIYPEELGDIRVQVTQVATDAITAAAIATGAITAAKFAVGAIDAAAIGTAAIDADAIATDAIAAAKIATGAITAAKFAAGAIDAAAIATAAITAAKFAAGAIDAAAIGTAAIDADAIATAAITAAKFGAGAIDAAAIATAAITAAKFAAGAVDAAAIGTAAIDADAIATDAIAAAKIATGAITAAKFAAGAVDAAAVAADAVAEIRDAIISDATPFAGANIALIRDSQVVRRNTAQAVTAGTITFDAGASAEDDAYRFHRVRIVSATTGVGQIRYGTDYVGSTKVLTLASNWDITPTGTIVFEILPGIGADLASVQNIADSVVFWKKNTARTNFTFGLFDSSGALTTGLTPTIQVKKDAETSYTTIVDAPAEIGTTGTYVCDFSAAELNGDLVTVKITAAGALDQLHLVQTKV